jgi:hypothetical protein
MFAITLRNSAVLFKELHHRRLLAYRDKDEERKANDVYRADARADALFISRGKNFGKSVSNR